MSMEPLDLLGETDLATGAFYVTLTDEPVVRTVHVTDLVMVDLDANNDPVGIEFAAGAPSDEDRDAVLEAFPALKTVLAA